MKRAPILIVDDEAHVLSALRRLLRVKDFRADITTSPKEALKWMGDYAYAVVISDYHMPEMNGIDFLIKVRSLQPQSQRLLMTGQGSEVIASEAINKAGISRYIKKPWDKMEILKIVQESFERHFIEIEQLRSKEADYYKQKELHEKLNKYHGALSNRNEKIFDLERSLEDSFLYSVRLLGQMIENYNKPLGEHSKRTAALAAEIATHFNLNGEEILQIEIAATLHEIGKIGLPENLIKKRIGDFTESEELLLKTHIEAAEHLLKDTPGFESITTIIKHQHEHYDGTGYPFKLKSDAIPLGSRIISATSAYDDAVHGRSSYSQADPTSALGYVKAKAGSYFDPKIVGVLIKYIETELRLNNLSDEEVRVHLEELNGGMVLSRNLVTSSGKQVLPMGSVIEDEYLLKILKINQEDPIKDEIFIYKESKR